jgi:hypothetical protein
MFGSARGPVAVLIILLATALCPTCPAFAADQAAPEPSEAIFIAQIVLLLLVARLLGEIMQRIDATAGLKAPSGFNPFLSEAFGPVTSKVSSIVRERNQNQRSVSSQVVRLSEIRECSRDSDCLASAKFSKAWGAAPVHPPTLAVVCSAVLAASGCVALTGVAGLELLKPAGQRCVAMLAGVAAREQLACA